jgi:coenzyme F420-reducing hydrogenase gamma subunit
VIVVAAGSCGVFGNFLTKAKFHCKEAQPKISHQSMKDLRQLIEVCFEGFGIRDHHALVDCPQRHSVTFFHQQTHQDVPLKTDTQQRTGIPPR